MEGILRPPRYFVKSPILPDYLGGRLIRIVVRLGREMKNPASAETPAGRTTTRRFRLIAASNSILADSSQTGRRIQCLVFFLGKIRFRYYGSCRKAIRFGRSCG